MFSYNSAILNEKTFISLTSLTISEFNDLSKTFSEQWEKHTNQESRDPKNGGRPPSLKTIDDRLFFILFYLKHIRFRKSLHTLLVSLKEQQTL